jgi:FixJ family two-component response regulator
MQLVVTGMLNKQVASELGTSEITVKIRRIDLPEKVAEFAVPCQRRKLGCLRVGRRDILAILGSAFQPRPL